MSPARDQTQLLMFPQLFRTEMFPDWSDELKPDNPATRARGWFKQWTKNKSKVKWQLWFTRDLRDGVVGAVHRGPGCAVDEEGHEH